ncbi:MAG: porin family protein [Spirochaetaceae bacterium]|jgi:hypothetical protein|nr:porin family protein [Spirochaetaceae bacterium]
MAKGFFKAAVFALFLAGLSAGAYAQITVSGGFALSSVSGIEMSGYGANIDSSVGFGGNVYLDYLLPVSIPLSLGVEAGFDTGSFSVTYSGTKYDETIMAIPLLLRVAYHFDLFPKLDLYLVGKIGYAFGIWTGSYRDMVDMTGYDVDTIGGLAFGFDAGVAYYFTSHMGLFIEAGFDDYMLETKISSSAGYAETLKAPFNRFVTVGLSTKF